MAKNGKITVKKGLKKGAYKLVVRITAAGDGDYTEKSENVKITIKVK